MKHDRRHRLTLMTLIAGAAGSAASAQQIAAQAPQGEWAVLDTMPLAVTAARPWVRPDAFAALSLDERRLDALLGAAPLEGIGQRPITLWLPTPEGGFARFSVVESPVMEPALQAQFPQIRTYLGQGIDDPAAVVRFDHTPQGFHAQVLTPQGAWYIDPYSRDDTTHYASYYKRDYRRTSPWACEGVAPGGVLPPPGEGVTDSPSGSTLRTYRLACACTGEYAIYHGGTVPLAQAAIVTAVNRVTGIYENELCLRLVLVANNTSIVFTNPATDGYTNGDTAVMLGQNQTRCDSIIGNANYDIGHVFGTDSGGQAGLGVVGLAGSKGRGVTGGYDPVGDPFYVDYVAHEMGHQFGANHTFNSVSYLCSGNRSAQHAYEPGSGSTMMSYSGICMPDDLQNNSDPYYIHDSHDAIIAYTSVAPGLGNTNVPTGNGIPTVSAGAARSIPKQTPFALTATGNDPNGDPLTFCWEQRDLGPSRLLSQGDGGSGPIIRTWPPAASPTRTIPRVPNLIANTFPLGEILPTTARTLNFRVTARDNRAGGSASNSADVAITVVGTAGPFQVTFPNAAATLSGQVTVTWNVANTNVAPISTNNVAILLSTNGGASFPTILASAVPNTGSATVTLPSITTSQARIKVAAIGNIYFDISNANFSIAPAGPSNSACSAALPLVAAQTPFDTTGSTTDGPSEANCGFCCNNTQVAQDIWYTYNAQCTGTSTVSVCGANFDSRIAIYNGSACPSAPNTAIACDDDFCGTASASQVTWNTVAGQNYKVRIGGFGSAAGSGTIYLSCAPTPPPSCYANCDGSTAAPVLNVLDFNCFLNRYTAGNSYANCDNSTVPPVLNVLDFNCFLNRFTAGCP
jgi:hypothetical protein